MKPSADTKTAFPVPALVPVFLFLIFGIPTVAAALPVLLVESVAAKLALTVLAPFTFTVSYMTMAALLSTPFQRAIIPGKFPRALDHVIYGPRRLYGLCWGAVFYMTPLYYALVSVPTLRKALLRAFGYKGHPDIALAPDAWIRDLPLLQFGQGAYVANKATIGTNICLVDGHIMVGPVKLDAGSLVGHLSMVAPGCSIGERSEIGVGGAIGIRARIGNRTRIGPTSSINHGADLGDDVDVGAMSYIGIKARIADGVRLPSASNIPEGAVISSQEDLRRHSDSETASLKQELRTLSATYAGRVPAAAPSPVAAFPERRASGE